MSAAVNWQRFCAGRGSVLPFLLRASYQLDEGVAPIILQLLQLAVSSPAAAAPAAKREQVPPALKWGS